VLTLTVPPSRVAGLLDALDHLEGASTSPGMEAFAGVRTDLARSTAEPARVTAARPLLRELISVALEEAGEALAAACRSVLRGAGTRAAVQARLEDVAGFVDLLELVERRPSGRS
jgi:hypothetical protein